MCLSTHLGGLSAFVGLGQGWGKESGQGGLEAAYHVLAWTEAGTESVRRAIHLVPANHLLHNWSLSLVDCADCGCFLSQRARSIYWPCVIFTTLDGHNSFQLNEQHLDGI